MVDVLPGKTAVIFTYGGAVFACNDATWDAILTDLAEFNGSDLSRIAQSRSQRLADRPLVHLGLMERDEARTRLKARRRAKAGVPDEAGPVVRQRFVPQRFVPPQEVGAGEQGDSRSATPSPETVKRQKPAAPHAVTVAKAKIGKKKK